MKLDVEIFGKFGNRIPISTFDLKLRKKECQFGQKGCSFLTHQFLTHSLSLRLLAIGIFKVRQPDLRVMNLFQLSMQQVFYL